MLYTVHCTAAGTNKCYICGDSSRLSPKSSNLQMKNLTFSSMCHCLKFRHPSHQTESIGPKIDVPRFYRCSLKRNYLLKRSWVAVLHEYYLPIPVPECGWGVRGCAEAGGRVPGYRPRVPACAGSEVWSREVGSRSSVCQHRLVVTLPSRPRAQSH